MTKRKFDRSICENCEHYWDYPQYEKSCHVHEKHIFDGECLEYKPKEQEMSQADKDAMKYKRYQDEWN